MGDLRPLVCPYCGAAQLVVNLETQGQAYLTYEVPGDITCEADGCEAVWEPDGTPRDAPRWVRYPDLYDPPPRAVQPRGDENSPPTDPEGRSEG